MSRHVIIAAALAVAGVLAGTLFLVRPADRQTRATYAEVADLMPLIATAPVHDARLHDLGYALDELGGHVRTICRTASTDADVEDVLDAVRRAATPRGVRHHAIRRGAAWASQDGSIVPLTIEIEGSFAAVFESIRHAETLSHPVRVTSVTMDVLEEETRDRSPMLAASIDLEVVFIRATMEAPQ